MPRINDPKFVENVAQVCHEANRAYCATLGDTTQKPWAEAEEWQRESARKGVFFTLSAPEAPASMQHEVWRSEKAADGWIHGTTKDAKLKTHPCMVPYEELPAEQRLKDYLFRAVVTAFVQAAAE